MSEVSVSMIAVATQYFNISLSRVRPVIAAERVGPPVVIDLCCGMGGLSLAAHEMGLHVAVGVDTNESSLRTFATNFPSVAALAGSVRSPKVIDACKEATRRRLEAGAPLIVVSGPPCQGFSSAGPRNPKDVRNRVLCDVARAINRLQPVCAVIENVATLLSAPHVSRLAVLRRTLQGGGYQVEELLLDASDFGVPQRRRRAFFLVTRQPIDAVELNAMLAAEKRPVRTVASALADLPIPQVRPDNPTAKPESLDVPNHWAMKHSPSVKAKIAAIAPGTGPMSYRRLHPDRVSNTLFSGHRAPPAHYREPRSITVREAARLQGFPDTFRVCGSFANQMQQVTNAVPPPLATVVLRTLLHFAEISKA